MQASLKNRIKRLEDANRPPEPAWTIPIIVREWGGDGGVFGRVIGRVPARLIEPGQPFDYRTGIDELIRAMGYDDA